MNKLSLNTINEINLLMHEDLNFHGMNKVCNLHKIHSFPAKFPPQLPAKFINRLTLAGEIVLDPMVGSGTTIIEAAIINRKAIGFDIDPLAILLVKAKFGMVKIEELIHCGYSLIERAQNNAESKNISKELLENFDKKTRDFINYWFLDKTKIELFAIVKEINKISNPELKDIFKVVFSSTIIAKTGGVSLALDLAHSRPHRAKTIAKTEIPEISLINIFDNSDIRDILYDKKIKSAFTEFKTKLNQISKLINSSPIASKAIVGLANTNSIPLSDNSVDLIVTSPPYPSNAIDYMRVHKFSLVWFNYMIDELSTLRKEFYGGENLKDVKLYTFSDRIEAILNNISLADKNKSLVIRRYYSEMLDMLKEMFRVLKPGKATIIVVGSSVIKGIDTEIQLCLKEIGQSIGFLVSDIGIRQIERNRRMLPASHMINKFSMIQNRMHYEYILGFVKP